MDFEDKSDRNRSSYFWYVDIITAVHMMFRPVRMGDSARSEVTNHPTVAEILCCKVLRALKFASLLTFYMYLISVTLWCLPK